MKAKHQHNFKARRPSPTVLVCDCGRFQHCGKFEPIVEQPRFRPEDEDLHNAEQQFRNGGTGEFNSR